MDSKLTLAQIEAISRLASNGWTVLLSTLTVERDGFAVGLMQTSNGFRMTVGISPEGSTHT